MTDGDRGGSGDRPALRRRIAETLLGAVPDPMLRWAVRRGAPMARVSGRTAVGSAALAQALAALARPPRRLRLRTGSLDARDVAERVDRDVEDVERWCALGLVREGVEGDRWDRDAVDRALLIDVALRRGGDESTLARAAAQDGLVLAALDAVLASKGPMTGPEVATEAGVPFEFLEALWRALGLPAGEVAAHAFDRRDVHAVRTLGALRTVFTEDDMAEAASVLGRAMSEVAAALTEVFRRRLAEPFLEAGETDVGIVARLAAMHDLLVPTMSPLLEVTLRRHLEGAIRSEISVAVEQMLEPGTGQRVASIAFADLVGFTEVSEGQPPSEVQRLASRLLRIAEAAVTAHGGRIVKTIGDAVMFTTAEPAQAASAALDVVESVAGDESLPPVRVGVAHGPVLPAYADYFGRTVNLASRLTSAAGAGEVLLHAAPEHLDDGALTAAGLRRDERVLRSLKGIQGPVRAHVVTRVR